MSLEAAAVGLALHFARRGVGHLLGRVEHEIAPAVTRSELTGYLEPLQDLYEKAEAVDAETRAGARDLLRRVMAALNALSAAEEAKLRGMQQQPPRFARTVREQQKTVDG